MDYYISDKFPEILKGIEKVAWANQAALVNPTANLYIADDQIPVSLILHLQEIYKVNFLLVRV